MITVSSRNLYEEYPPRSFEFGDNHYEREEFFTALGKVSQFLQEIAAEMCDNNHSDLGIYHGKNDAPFDDHWRRIGTIKDVGKSAELLGLIADNYYRLVSRHNEDIDEDENYY